MSSRYFDANATTPLSAEAAEAWQQAQQTAWANPASPSRAGAAAHRLLEEARAQIAECWQAPAEAIVFTSGATEANGGLLAWLAGRDPAATVAITAVEHPCLRESAHHHLAGRCHELPVDGQGVLELAALEDYLRAHRPALVCVMAANNETGVVQPWREALALCRQAGVPLHVDAAQWLGKRPAAELAEVPLLTGCAHKFGGPKGIGFLKLSPDFYGLKLQRGGEQENGHRAGTENPPAAAAMAAALRARETGLAEVRRAWAARREALEEAVQASIPGTVVLGQSADRLENTSLLQLPRHRHTRWAQRLDRRGFAVSTGAACATGKEGPSHVLRAMGVDPQAGQRVIRISADWNTPQEDWRALAEAFGEIWQELQSEDTAPGGTTVIDV